MKRRNEKVETKQCMGEKKNNGQKIFLTKYANTKEKYEVWSKKKCEMKPRSHTRKKCKTKND